MAHGSIVADGPDHRDQGDGRACARSGRRCPTSTSPSSSALPGVNSAERRGDAIVLHCADSDAAIRALLQAYPGVRDIEIAGAGLEQAFLQLTAEVDAS